VVVDGEFEVWQGVSGGDPGVGEDLSRSPPLHGVHVQHAQHQVLGRGGHCVPVATVEGNLALANSGQDLFGRVLGTSGKRCTPKTGGTNHVMAGDTKDSPINQSIHQKRN